MNDNLSKSAKAFQNFQCLSFVTIMTVVKFHILNVYSKDYDMIVKF